MAAISFAMSRGVEGTKITDFTIGTSAPGAGDFELRYNTTDTNGKNVTREDIVKFCDAVKKAVITGGATVNFTTAPPL